MQSARRSIAVITSNAYSLGNFRGPLIRAFLAAGWRVFALAPDYDEQTRETVRLLGAEPVDIDLDRTGLKPIRDLASTAALARTLRRLAPDATLAYFIKPVIYGSIAAWAAGVPRRYALVPGLGYLFVSDPSGDRIKRRLLRRLATSLYGLGFRVCRKVFFQNNEDRQYFVEAGVLPPEKAVRVNGTGVDLERLRPLPPVMAPIRFLLMARLLREKGIGEFVEAARLVRKRHANTEFVILGGFDPNPGGFTRDEVQSWTADGVIQWMGHIDDVTPYIAASSVFVLPSYYREGIPRSNQEAMALARPVITTDNVGCRETVIDGVTGFLVPPRDVEALARAMERFVTTPALIESMGGAARSFVERKFDTRVVNATMLREMEIV